MNQACILSAQTTGLLKDGFQVQELVSCMKEIEAVDPVWQNGQAEWGNKSKCCLTIHPNKD